MAESIAQLLHNGQQALEVGRLDDAVAAFVAVQAHSPHDVAVAIALANVYRLQGDMAKARETLEQAHAGDGWADAVTAYALGTALLESGAPREAVTCFQRVVAQRGGDPAALNALAGARRAAGEPAAAWPQIQRAIAAAPDTPAFALTAAQVRHDLGDLDGALHWVARADALRPDHAPTHLQRAYSTLLRGASHAGWSAFESRPLPVPNTNARAWQGESIEGASILVTAEQGIGDQFQFVRFVHQLAAYRPARVVVECHADVVSLFVGNGLDAVPRGAPPVTDWHVPLMSLPFHLHCDSHVDSECVPYLRATAPFTGVLPSRTVPKRLGLVWAGNPAFTGRATRDLDVALLSQVVGIAGIQWISLQHGDAGQVALDGLQHIVLPRDWAGTAALLTQLDGLVTTDTGIAHLAGAMGIPTWVLLQHVPDWRWGLSGTQCAWYPTLTLLRQPRARDWQSVVPALAHALTDASV